MALDERKQYMLRQQQNFFVEETTGRIPVALIILTLSVLTQIIKALQGNRISEICIFSESTTILVVLLSSFALRKFDWVKIAYGDLVFANYFVANFIAFVFLKEKIFYKFVDETNEDNTAQVLDKDKTFSAFTDYNYRIAVMEATIMMFCCVFEKYRIIFRTVVRLGISFCIVFLIEISL